MKQSGIIAIVFIVGCATGGVAAQLIVPPVRAGTAPTRWEYQCAQISAEDDLDRTMTSALNKFGAAGWELSSLIPVERGLRGRVWLTCGKRALPASGV